MRASPYTETESGIEIESCQVRGVQKRYTVAVNKKTNNHKSVSMSNYKTINNQSISNTLLLLLPVSSTVNKIMHDKINKQSNIYT